MDISFSLWPIANDFHITSANGDVLWVITSTTGSLRGNDYLLIFVIFGVLFLTDGTPVLLLCVKDTPI